MAVGFTNRAKLRMLEAFFQDVFSQSGFAIALVTDTPAPDADTNVLADLTEIVAGNGYSSGGNAIARDNIGFPTSSEDDSADTGSLIMEDTFFTASGGILPASGDGVKFAVLTDNNTIIADREVFAYAEYGAVKTLLDGQMLSVAGLKFTLKEGT